MKTAIIYYSKTGTTQKIANQIADAFDGELFPIESEKAYGGYFSSVLRVLKEKITHHQPKAKKTNTNFNDYDLIFVGFPVWAETMPQIVEDYLNQCQLSNKKIAGFVTATLSGKDKSLAKLKSTLPNCEIISYIYQSKKEQPDIEQWLNQIKTIL